MSIRVLATKKEKADVVQLYTSSSQKCHALLQSAMHDGQAHRLPQFIYGVVVSLSLARCGRSYDQSKVILDETMLQVVHYLSRRIGHSKTILGCDVDARSYIDALLALPVDTVRRELSASAVAELV